MTTDENDRIPHPCRGGLIFHGESHRTVRHSGGCSYRSKTGARSSLGRGSSQSFWQPGRGRHVGGVAPRAGDPVPRGPRGCGGGSSRARRVGPARATCAHRRCSACPRSPHPPRRRASGYVSRSSSAERVRTAGGARDNPLVGGLDAQQVVPGGDTPRTCGSGSWQGSPCRTSTPAARHDPRPPVLPGCIHQLDGS